MPFAFVTSVSASSTTGDNVTTAVVNSAGSTLLVMAVASGNGTITVSDANGNTWVPLTKYSTPVGGDTIRLYTVRNGTVGVNHDFTVTSTGQFPAVAVCGYSGTVSAVQQSDADLGNVSSKTDLTTDISPGTVTTKDTGALLVLAAQYDLANSGWVADAPFTLRQNRAATATAFGLTIADSIETVPVTRTPRLTWVTAVAAVATVAEFRVVPGTTSDDPSARADENTQMRTFLQNWFAENNPDISSHRNRFSRLNTATSPAGGVSDIANEYTLLVRAARGLTS